MIKYIALFSALVLIAVQARPAGEQTISILRSESDFKNDGSYKFMFEGSDGTFREETGVPRNVGQEDQFVAITGIYKYIDVDGQPVEVHYTADEHGFVPVGTHIPEAIVRAAKASTEIH